MSSRKNKVPAYRCHKQSGQAVVTLTDGFGSRRDLLLGRFGSKESRQAYARALAEWEVGGGAVIATQADLTINELLVLYVRHVEDYYRLPDGTPVAAKPGSAKP